MTRRKPTAREYAYRPRSKMLRDIKINLGPRAIAVDGKSIGTCDSLYITIVEATDDEVAALIATKEIKLVRLPE